MLEVFYNEDTVYVPTFELMKCIFDVLFIDAWLRSVVAKVVNSKSCRFESSYTQVQIISTVPQGKGITARNVIKIECFRYRIFFPLSNAKNIRTVY